MRGPTMAGISSGAGRAGRTAGFGELGEWTICFGSF